MAEFTSAEKVNIGYENEYSTDAMTGGPDKRRQLYYQLIQSMKKAESVDIIVSFLMESVGDEKAQGQVNCPCANAFAQQKHFTAQKRRRERSG